MNNNLKNYNEKEEKVYDRIYMKEKLTSISLLDGDGGAINNENFFEVVEKNSKINNYKNFNSNFENYDEQLEDCHDLAQKVAKNNENLFKEIIKNNKINNMQNFTNNLQN